MEAIKTETLTNEQRRKIIEAIADCNRFIEREEKRDASLRPTNVSATLSRYKAHITRMVRSLEENRLIPVA